MSSLPIASTASLHEQVLTHLALAVNGEIILVFHRSTTYHRVKKVADKIPNSQIRLQQVRVTYEILADNEVYDTSPKVKY